MSRSVLDCLSTRVVFIVLWAGGIATGFGVRAAEISLAEAIRRTLDDQPGVQIQWEAVRAAEGAWQSTRGQFDANVLGGVNLERRDTPVPPYAGPLSPLESREDTASLGVSKQFRTGVTLTPQINVIDAANADTRGQRVATSEVAVAVTVPLLRGAGRASAAAGEQAAALSWQAQGEAARFAVEGRVFATVNAYWSAVGATEAAALLAETLDRGRDFMETLTVMREAGLIERANEEQAAAELADYERQLSGAMTAARVARFNLGAALGLEPTVLSATPPVPADALPAVSEPPDEGSGARLVASALQARGDHRAVLLAVERAQVLLRRAERDVRPQLDLVGRVGYAGGAADTGRLSRVGGSLGENHEGPNAAIGFSLAWPVRNDFAEGLLRQQRAAARTAELNADLSAQSLTVAVLSAWESLRGAAREHRLALDAAARLAIAATRERERAQNGEATVAEVIQLEQRLLAARLAAITTRQNHAILLAQVRLLAGLLTVPGEQDRATFDLAQLRQLPVLTP